MNNSMETLKKAKQELAFAEDCLKASQEAVKEAQEVYTEAYKVFKEEADGLLREDDKTSEMCSNDCFTAIYKPLDIFFDDLNSLSVGITYRVTKTPSVHYEIGGYSLSRYAFNRRFLVEDGVHSNEIERSKTKKNF